MSDFITVCNLKRYFKSGDNSLLKVLEDINFSVSKGSTVAITGQSGAGKSVLLQLLGGLDQPTAGECLIDGVNIYQYPLDQLAVLRNKLVGFIFQFNQLLPDFTALENVMIPALIQGVPKKLAQEKAEYQIEQMAMIARRDYKINRLSGGEQQRIAIARALINNPALVLADEPTGSLDYKTGQSVIDVLLSKVEKAKTTLILVTHNLALAKLMGTLMEIRFGKIFRQS